MQTIVILCRICAVPLAHGHVGRVEGRVHGVVQVATAVILAQSEVSAGRVVDAALPHVPPMFCGAGAEGLLHLLITVGAVAVAVVSPGRLEVEPLQGLLHAALPSS